VSQALLALGSGGLFGVGLGNSMQKHFLPEPHTDFVFAFAGEELGLFGTLSVVALFIALGVHGYRIATQAATYHGFLLASGITVMVGTYALLNVGVATGLMPTTGLPLPFISYGGSSLLWNLSGIGILAAVARDTASESSSSSRLARDLAWNRRRSASRGGAKGWIPPTAASANR
jgi:cell division protein FtsW